MAKKKKTKKDPESANEPVVEEGTDSTEEVEAAESESDAAEEPVVPEAAASEKGEGKDHWERLFVAWPVDPDHQSAAEVLQGTDADANADVSLDKLDLDTGGNSKLNFALLVLIAAVAGVGIWQFSEVSSAEALEAKRQERLRVEQEHLEEQLAKQKKYGVLRIESDPAQAIVFKNGEKIVTTSEETGEQITGMTPINMMNLDIAQPYHIKLEKEGYEPFEFNVAEHLWTKDSGSGEYKFFKMVELTPNTCEYWFLYDAKRKRELKFADKVDKKTEEVTESGKQKCQEHYDDAVSQGVSVTECTCKLPEDAGEKKDE